GSHGSLADFHDFLFLRPLRIALPQDHSRENRYHYYGNHHINVPARDLHRNGRVRGHISEWHLRLLIHDQPSLARDLLTIAAISFALIARNSLSLVPIAKAPSGNRPAPGCRRWPS